MALNVTEEWLKAYTARTGKSVKENGGRQDPKASATAPPEGKRQSKYGNERTEVGGEKFDSRHEAKCWEQVKLRQRAGEFAALARQAVFMLPGGVKYIADFVGIKPDGKVEVFDAKSEATRKDKAYRIKKRLMKYIGYEITEI